MPRVLVCPDSFKGSLSAKEVCETIKNALLEKNSDLDIIEIPLADGGEGTFEIMREEFPSEISIITFDPLLRPIKTSYLLDISKQKAFIETAKCIGLPLLKRTERNPLLTTSRGIGEIIKDAIGRGVKEITVSLGGSATNDGGLGMLSSLGFQFVDKNGKELKGFGKDTFDIYSIFESPLYEKFKNITFNILCDVDNPLLGESGATFIYSPQKGAKASDLPFLERGLENFALKAIENGYGSIYDIRSKGSGAAGGLGFAFSAFFNANKFRGIEYIIESKNIGEIIAESDLIITGEGKCDRQSLMGKVLSGLLPKAKQNGLPVIVVAGQVEDRDILKNEGVTKILEISDKNLSLDENMKPETAIKNIRKGIQELSPTIFHT